MKYAISIFFVISLVLSGCASMPITDEHYRFAANNYVASLGCTQDGLIDYQTSAYGQEMSNEIIANIRSLKNYNSNIFLNNINYSKSAYIRSTDTRKKAICNQFASNAYQKKLANERRQNNANNSNQYSPRNTSCYNTVVGMNCTTM